MERLVLCIMGPTGVGKTALAFWLAQTIDRMDLISVDSAMIYRGMDIGTAKPTAAEQTRLPHQLIDVCDPDQRYSVGQFCMDAQECIDQSLTQGRLPVLVGGTMMYFNRLQQGIIQVPDVPEDIQQAIEKEKEKKGSQAMHQLLSAVDPALAKRLHPHDTQRIMRGLGVYRATQQPLSAWQASQKQVRSDYTWLNIGLWPEDRNLLHQALARRFDGMIEQGLQDELHFLIKKYALSADLPSMRCVGYRQMLAYIQGKMCYDAMRQQSIVATRQLAKRQMTWMRSWPQLLSYSGDLASVRDKILDRLQRLRIPFV